MKKINFIMDIGNVLIDFLPLNYLESLFPGDVATQSALNGLIFRSAEWLELDRGTFRHPEAIRRFVAQRPDLEPQIRRTMDGLPTMLTPISATVALLPRIKAAGHGLYFLSNYHADLVPFIHEYIPFFSRFDGGVFSCDVHMLKPNPDIYGALLQRYGLDPASCVFFDDTLENVAAANHAGIRGVLFTGPEDIAQYLDA